MYISNFLQYKFFEQKELQSDVMLTSETIMRFAKRARSLWMNLLFSFSLRYKFQIGEFFLFFRYLKITTSAEYRRDTRFLFYMGALEFFSSPANPCSNRMDRHFATRR